MFIQTENTPNPLTLKFMPGQKVAEGNSLEFKNKDEAKNSVLASLLFKNTNVTNVFFGKDFISVTKAEDVSWDALKPDILSKIMDFFSSGGKVSGEEVNPSVEENIKEGDEKIVKEIKVLLDEKIKPAVAQDGGDINFIKFDEGVVFLELRGACAGCPSSTLTLKSGIENMLKYYIPEIVSVEAIN